MLKINNPKSYKQLHTDSWLQVRNAIHNDKNLEFRTACKDLLIFIQHRTNYMTGEVKISVKDVQKYLDCSRATAYGALKWFKDNGILTARDTSGAVPLPSGEKASDIYYGKSGEQLFLCEGLLRLGTPQSDKQKHEYARKTAPRKTANAKRVQQVGDKHNFNWSRYASDPEYAASCDAVLMKDPDYSDLLSEIQDEIRKGGVTPPPVQSRLPGQDTVKALESQLR